MRRGTTPTLKIKIKGIDISRLTSMYITIKQGDREITKENEDISIEEDGILSVRLSQEDTLTFTKGHVDIQLRAMTDNGVAIASGIQMAFMEQILKEGEIT